MTETKANVPKTPKHTLQGGKKTRVVKKQKKIQINPTFPRNK
jgi:hypothetical protein